MAVQYSIKEAFTSRYDLNPQLASQSANLASFQKSLLVENADKQERFILPSCLLKPTFITYGYFPLHGSPPLKNRRLSLVMVNVGGVYVGRVLEPCQLAGSAIAATILALVPTWGPVYQKLS